MLILWARGRFELVVSHRLLHELESVLLRPWFRRKLSYEEVLEYVLWLREKGTLTEEGDIKRVTADPDDDYIIALARVSGAERVVSGDRHLLDVVAIADSEGNLLSRVLSPRRFLGELE